MFKLKRWHIVSMVLLGLLLTLAAGGAAILSNYLRSDALRVRLLSLIQQQTGWDVTCRNIHLGLLPLPHADVSEIAVRIPETGTITAVSLEVYPRLRMLLAGKVQIAKLRINTPVIRVSVPAPPSAPRPQRPAPPSPAAEKDLMESEIVPAFRQLAAYFQNGLVLIEDAKLRVETGGRPSVDLSRLNFRLEVKTAGLHLAISTWSERLKRELSFSGAFQYRPGRMVFEGLAGTFGASSFSGLSGHLQWGTDPGIRIGSGSFSLGMNILLPILTEAGADSELLRNLSGLSLKFRIASAGLNGPLAEPLRWKIDAAGDVDDLSVRSQQFTGLGRVRSGSFSLHQGDLRFDGVRVSLLDASLQFSSSLKFLVGAVLEPIEGDMKVTGSLGPQILQRTVQDLGLPSKFTPRAPVKIDEVRFRWKRSGRTSLKADLTWPDQLVLSAAGSFGPNERKMERLSLRDPLERLDASWRLTPQALDLSFSANSSTELMNRLFVVPLLDRTLVRGGLMLHMPLKDSSAFRAQGDLVLQELLLPLPDSLPVHIASLKLSGEPDRIGVDLGQVTWGETRLTAQGAIRSAPQGLTAALEVKAENVDADSLLNTVNALGAASAGTAPPSPPLLPYQLDLEVLAEHARFQGFKFGTVRSNLRITPEVVDLSLNPADLSGISITGRVQVKGSRIYLDLIPSATQQDLESALNTQFGDVFRMTGKFDVSGRVAGQGTDKDLLERLQGNLQASAQKGRIYKMNFMSKVLSILNLAEILVGTLPQLGKEGIGYSEFTLQARVKQGRLNFDEIILRADNMDVTGQGTVRIEDGGLALVVLVAPLKMANRIIGAIPFVNYIFNDHLVAFPFEVSGTLGDPKVVSTVPAKADEGVYGIMKRTVLLPVHIVSPFIPKGQEAGTAPEPVTRSAEPRQPEVTPEASAEDTPGPAPAPALESTPEAVLGTAEPAPEPSPSPEPKTP
jgi:hypothetical protein